MKSENKQYSKWPFKFTEAMQLFTRAEIIIYSILCTRANDKGKVWPGYASLIEDTNVDRKTIAKALKTLQKYEFLELVTKRYHDSTIYRVTQPEDMTSIYEELERRGLTRFTWLHDREESNESKWSGFHFHSDSNNGDEKAKVEFEQSQSGVSDESKWSSEVVKVESDGTETTLNRTTLNTSTLKDFIGTFEEKPVSDADIPKTGISTSSKANALVPKDGDIQEDSKNGNSHNEDESSSNHPVSKSSNSGAKKKLKSSDSNNHRPMESDEDTFGTDNSTDEGENMNAEIERILEFNRRAAIESDPNSKSQPAVPGKSVMKEEDDKSPSSENQRRLLESYGLTEFHNLEQKGGFCELEEEHGEDSVKILLELSLEEHPPKFFDGLMHLFYDVEEKLSHAKSG